MKVGGESRLGYVRVRHWERFAADLGLPTDEVLGICESVAAETPDRFAEVVAAARSEELDHPVVERLEEAVATQGQSVPGKPGKMKEQAAAPPTRAPGVVAAGLEPATPTM